MAHICQVISLNRGHHIWNTYNIHHSSKHVMVIPCVINHNYLRTQFWIVTSYYSNKQQFMLFHIHTASVSQPHIVCEEKFISRSLVSLTSISTVKSTAPQTITTVFSNSPFWTLTGLHKHRTLQTLAAPEYSLGTPPKKINGES